MNPAVSITCPTCGWHGPWTLVTCPNGGHPVPANVGLYPLLAGVIITRPSA